MLDIDDNDEDHNFFFLLLVVVVKKQIMKLCILAREKNKTLGSPCIAHTQINKETDRQNEIQYALSSLSRVLSLKEWKKECAPLSLFLSIQNMDMVSIHDRYVYIVDDATDAVAASIDAWMERTFFYYYFVFISLRWLLQSSFEL